MVFFLLPKTPFVILVTLGLIFLLLSHPLWQFWWVERSWRRRLLACTALIAALTVLGRSAWPSPTSFAFITPGVVINGDSWDFVVSHRGPDAVHSVDMVFNDVDAVQAIQRFKSGDIAAATRRLHFDDVYPKGRGTIFARQFIWKPSNFDHEHFAVDISDSNNTFHEEIHVERVSGKWVNAIAVSDIDHKRTVLTCRDGDFPASVAKEIKPGNVPCFPNVIALGE